LYSRISGKICFRSIPDDESTGMVAVTVKCLVFELVAVENVEKHTNGTGLSHDGRFVTKSSRSGFIVLLGSVLQYSGELDVVEHSVLDGGLSVHLIHVVVSEPVSDGGE